jgi:lysozyme family protein
LVDADSIIVCLNKTILFDTLSKYIRIAEGGYSNDPNDAGGETNCGVTYKTFVALSSKLGYKPTKENFLKMPKQIWDAILMEFYEYSGAYLIPHKPAIQFIMVDFSWGSGRTQTIICLQRALIKLGYPVSISGELDEATLESVRFADEGDLLKLFVLEWASYINQLADKYPMYKAGWNSRIQRHYSIAKKLL